MAKAKRLEQLLLFINQKKQFTLKELADEFKVSARTIQRDLLHLMDRGLPILSEYGPHGGYTLMREKILPPIGFSESEALSFLFALQWLGESDSFPYAKDAHSAREKLMNYLSDDGIKQLSNIEKKWQGNRPLSDQVPVHLSLFFQAAMEQRIITVEYEWSGDLRISILQPIGVIENGYNWYSPCYNPAEKTVHLLNLKNIKTAVIENECHHVNEYSALPVSQWNELVSPQKKLNLHVTLNSNGANKALNHPVLCRSTKLSSKRSGQIQTIIPREALPVYAEWIWAFGADAYVVSPPELVDYLRAKTDEMAQIYETITAAPKV
ncbi:WYL domain-containing protein [Fictibacillus enclensis]|uniref:helix-turn-helix transcriptional regulator n=1 Tax=Fictibacillus enclensis TaxID=1017270 RepID=UPI0025A26921|nr:WYL domain-containing protein [Fictibacillus enclensis]MDM5337682.1 WYL domain-containing protein [Fictibacillus enclensis]